MTPSRFRIAPGSIWRAAIVSGALAIALMAGCSEVPSVVSTTPEGAGGAQQDASGSLQIALAVPPNFQINTVSYLISKTGFSQTGSLNVSQAANITATLGGIPAGTGYTLTLAATDAAKKLSSCTGSAPFSVTAGAVTPVNVDIACRVAPPPAAPKVPIPMPAVALLALAILFVGTSTLTVGRRRRGAAPGPSVNGG